MEASELTSEPAPKRRKRATGSNGTGAAGPAASQPEHEMDAPAASPAVAEDGSTIEADHVEVMMGAVGRVESRELDVDRGAVGAARAEHVTAQRSAIGAVVGGEVEIGQSFVQSVLAREVRTDQSIVRAIVAQDVHVERSSLIGVLLARRVVGDVRVILDWRGAVALGAAAGLVLRLLGRGRGRGNRR